MPTEPGYSSMLVIDTYLARASFHKRSSSSSTDLSALLDMAPSRSLYRARRLGIVPQRGSWSYGLPEVRRRHKRISLRRKQCLEDTLFPWQPGIAHLRRKDEPLYVDWPSSPFKP